MTGIIIVIGTQGLNIVCKTYLQAVHSIIKYNIPISVFVRWKIDLDGEHETNKPDTKSTVIENENVKEKETTGNIKETVGNANANDFLNGRNDIHNGSAGVDVDGNPLSLNMVAIKL